jgi:hypothetical protein
LAKDIREFTGPDGVHWGVQVKLPGSSNAMIVFYHPGGKTARLDRYAWFQWHGPEARSVTGTLKRSAVMNALTPPVLALLFRRSMPISAGRTPLTEETPEEIADEFQPA